VNERHESGYAPDYDAYGYDPYSTGTYQTVGTGFADDTATGTYAYIPQQQPYGTYDQGQAQSHPQGQAQDYGYPQQQAYDPPAAQSGWDTGGYQGYDPYAYGQTTAPTATGTATYYDTGTYVGLTDFPQAPLQMEQPQQDWDSGAYPAYGYGTGYATGYGYDASGDTGVYEQVAPPVQEPEPAPAAYGSAYQDFGTAEFTAADYAAHATTGFATEFPTDFTAADLSEADLTAHLDEIADPYAASADLDDEPVRHDYASDGFADGDAPVARSRRRKPAKRSALLTVAVPSVAVMGVAAVGAAAVTGVGMAQETSSSQADAATGKAPTTQLDRQLAGVSRDADDFASRASRSQERLDLKERQAAAKKAAEVTAARKEALRPKFVLPVTQKGLSAYFGQAGVNWMALHTGIDFPVQVGTPVMAVTDGTVRTQWNSSYGNMAIVTAPDGTETWYCHLSSTKIRSGKVKAGTVIAYSGNTGNTTGPHLHLEVRPHGGSPIDPLPWLLAHGLDPR
jgi:murein DD-endopeptidase MepM/ murein hydrolase activator NlpD